MILQTRRPAPTSSAPALSANNEAALPSSMVADFAENRELMNATLTPGDIECIFLTLYTEEVDKKERGELYELSRKARRGGCGTGLQIRKGAFASTITCSFHDPTPRCIGIAIPD